MFTTLVEHFQKQMDNITTITLLLPESEAKKWLLFQQYYDTFTILVENGAFEVKNGNVVMNFDLNGTLKSIARNDLLWRKFDLPIQ